MLHLLSGDLIALFAAAVVFVSGLAGLYVHVRRPEQEGGNETRDLINRLTGLVATLSALVLGLLIASANSFYNTQKDNLEMLSIQVVQLDGLLRLYGPDALPARDLLKDIVTNSYERVWQGDSVSVQLTTEQARKGIGELFGVLNAMREGVPEARKFLVSKAADLTASINDQRLQLSLQSSNSLSWPFMTVLVSWVCLLFFGFGMLAPLNRTAVAGLAVGALSVASAIFLIIELSTPYSGLLQLSPEPILKTIAVIDK